jgi:hypothetical protein
MDSPALVRKHPWQPPALTVEMPFRETYAATGCTSDAAVVGAPPGATYTPVVKVGASADAEFITCAGTS